MTVLGCDNKRLISRAPLKELENFGLAADRTSSLAQIFCATFKFISRYFALFFMLNFDIFLKLRKIGGDIFDLGEAKFKF